MLFPSPLVKNNASNSSSDAVELSVSQLLNPLGDFLVQDDVPITTANAIRCLGKVKPTSDYGSDDDTYIGDDSWYSGTSESSLSSLDDDDNSDNDDCDRSVITAKQPIPFCHRVTFADEGVLEDTVLIPHFSDYTSEERRCIWSSSEEVDAIMARGTKEFLYEHWDWMMVLEEDQFIEVRISPGRTVLVHPASVRDFMRQLQAARQAARERARETVKLAHQRAQERVHGERNCASSDDTKRVRTSAVKSKKSRRSMNVQQKRCPQKWRLPRSAKPSLTRFADT